MSNSKGVSYLCPLPLMLLLCTGRDFMRMSHSNI